MRNVTYLVKATADPATAATGLLGTVAAAVILGCRHLIGSSVCNRCNSSADQRHLAFPGHCQLSVLTVCALGDLYVINNSPVE